MIGTAVQKGKIQLQRIVYDAKGKSTVKGLTNYVRVDRVDMPKMIELVREANNGASKVALAKLIHLFWEAR